MVFILQYSNCITYVLFQVIDWLVTEGEELLSHHQDVCDNLKGIKAQQKDFDKLYFSAMVSQTNIFLGYWMETPITDVRARLNIVWILNISSHLSMNKTICQCVILCHDLLKYVKTIWKILNIMMKNTFNELWPFLYGNPITQNI